MTVCSAGALSQDLGRWIVVAGTFKSAAEAKKWVDQNEPPDFFGKSISSKRDFRPAPGRFLQRMPRKSH